MLYSQEQLAAAYGVSRSTFTRYIQMLQDEGKFKKNVSHTYRYTESEVDRLSELLETDLKKKIDEVNRRKAG